MKPCGDESTSAFCDEINAALGAGECARHVMRAPKGFTQDCGKETVEGFPDGNFQCYCVTWSRNKMWSGCQNPTPEQAKEWRIGLLGSGLPEEVTYEPIPL